MTDRLLYAITGHGYGHATRSAAIGKALKELYSSLYIVYSTTVPRSVLERSGAFPDGLRPQDYEPGTAEGICFEVDPQATRAAYRRFASERQRRIEKETEHLRQGRYRGLISDIAAVPIAAASRAEVPAVALSNFTWDWILEPILGPDPSTSSFLEEIRGDYRSAVTYLRLPFHPREHPFRSVEDLPLVGRKATLARDEARRRLGIDPASRRPVVMVTIGGFQAGGWPPIEVPGCSDLEFVLVGPMPVHIPTARIHPLPEDLGQHLTFPDLVLAADLVMAKPGYGTCSECAVNGTPLLLIERKGFRESKVLQEGVSRVLPCGEISLEDFLAGRWEGPLRAVLGRGPGSPAPSDGAREAARRIGESLGL